VRVCVCVCVCARAQVVRFSFGAVNLTLYVNTRVLISTFFLKFWQFLFKYQTAPDIWTISHKFINDSTHDYTEAKTFRNWRKEY